jgi:hypothetical protein
MPLKTLVLAIWAAIHPAAPKLPDAPEIAAAIETVITQDRRPPVFGSREEDAAVMAYWALRESWLRRNAVGDGGRSFGVWQENASTGRADILTQARAWLYMLHEGARICPDNPAAPLSGGCRAAARIAQRRVVKALELLATAKRALEPPPPLPPPPQDSAPIEPDGPRPVQEGAPAEPDGPRRTKSAAFSPIIIDGAFVLPPTTVGLMDASATRRPSTSARRRRSGPTTFISSTPIRHVPTGWYTVFA